MKVFYDGPGAKTYHPQLGLLIKGKVFEPKDVGMTKEQIQPYIDSMLLKKAEKNVTKKTVTSDESRVMSKKSEKKVTSDEC